MGFIDNNDIENFTKDGAILCKGIFSDWVDKLRIGVDKLIANQREIAHITEVAVNTRSVNVNSQDSHYTHKLYWKWNVILLGVTLHKLQFMECCASGYDFSVYWTCCAGLGVM